MGGLFKDLWAGFPEINIYNRSLVAKKKPCLRDIYMKTGDFGPFSAVQNPQPRKMVQNPQFSYIFGFLTEQDTNQTDQQTATEIGWNV